VHLHGGGYDQGRKNSQSLPLLYRLASQGWTCVSANYRLPARLEDADTSVTAAIGLNGCSAPSASRWSSTPSKPSLHG
jgi:hypothetical protein